DFVHAAELKLYPGNIGEICWLPPLAGSWRKRPKKMPQIPPSNISLRKFHIQSFVRPPCNSQEKTRPPNVPPKTAPRISEVIQPRENNSNAAKTGVNPIQISQS